MTERQRRILERLLRRATIAWGALYLPPLVVAGLFGQFTAPLRWVLQQPAWVPLLIALHTAAVVGGWSAVLVDRWQRLKRGLMEQRMAETLEELHAMPPQEFEVFVAEVFRKQGFRVWDVRFQADHGVDLQLITPDGIPAVAQIKRYADSVGEPAVRDLYGTMINAGARRAYLINTGGFSRPAQEWVRDKPIHLIDGRTLLTMAANAGDREPRPGEANI